ncbi:unnamed protein product [Parajaminaea phylloscopi]
MKGYVIDEDIPLTKLSTKLRSDAPEPKPDANQVVIEVHSAALNFFDVLQLAGKYQVKKPFPYTLGVEVAGVVAKDSPIPDGCDLKPGDRVFGAANGSYADRVAADFVSLLPIPSGMNFDEASSLFITYPTSYAALVFRANLQAGETVLVHAGAGGVGLAAIQIAKALGATVIATAGSDEKLRVCKEVGGADEVVNYRDEKWPQKVKELTGGNGVDVVYDPVGLLNPSLKCIAWNGRLVVIGFAAGTIEKIPANLILLKNCSVTGLFWGAYSKNELDKIPEAWNSLLELFAQKKIKPTVFEKIYQGLESLPEGLKDLAERKTWGKAVVRVRSEN